MGTVWKRARRAAVLTAVALACGPCLAVGRVLPEEIPGLICFWDFPDGEGRLTAKGPHAYVLEERNGTIAAAEEGIFPGGHALDIRFKQWLVIPREKCPALNLKGGDEVTMVAWIKRRGDAWWQYIAGVWNERDELRQYALFTCGGDETDWKTLERKKVRNRVHGYVSEVGGATQGKPFCFSYATGAGEVPEDEWVMAAYTYDGKELRVYFNGELDANGNANPFKWDEPIFDPGEKGADFTVAQRAVPKWPGYPEEEESPHNVGFAGLLGGLAVYDRALTAEEMSGLYAATMEGVSGK